MSVLTPFVVSLSIPFVVSLSNPFVVSLSNHGKTIMNKLITQHLDLWTAAIKRKSSAGRGSSSKVELYGIKKLRELILELAVRGLLVSQDTKDEPASELLKRIAAEKARLIKEKAIRKSRPLAPISDDEKFMRLPMGWGFARLNDIGDWGAGATPSRNNPELYGGSIPWFKSGELVADYISQSEETVTELALEKASLRYNKVGDVLIAMYGATIGKTAILSVPATTNQAVCACTPFTGIESTYLLTLLKAYKPRFIGMGAGGAQPNISREKIIETVVAVPPIAEQHRIVAKVDELMALCDQLEQQTDASLSAHQTLVETLLNALTSAPVRPELVEGRHGEGRLGEGCASTSSARTAFDAAWQRIAEHFDTLFTTEESVDQLKQTILQLAVMGKLVPQDPNDEPASELLKKIAAEKARLVKEGKIKREKPLPPVGDEKKPFELPKGWAWARFPELGEFGRGKSKHRPRNEPKLFDPGIYPLVQTGEVARANGVIKEYHSKYSDLGLLQSKMWPAGTLCITIAANIADSALLGFDACFPDSVVGFVPLKPLDDARYLLTFMKTARAELLKFAPATAQKNINLEILESVLIPIPPKKEIARISSKVSDLVALCDQLKFRLNTAEQLRNTLVDAITDASLNPPSGKVIPFPDTAVREARRHAVGCHVVAALKNQRSFGRTMLMKLIYLADTHVGADLAMEVERYAAGPFDRWIYRFEEHAKAAGWFDHEKTQGDKIRYKLQAGLAAQAAKAHELLDADQVAELDRMLKLFAGLSTEDAEIIATLFAAWNDFLIDGHTPDDAEVIREVRENWTPEKQRFSADKLQTWLDWMRKNKLVPRGLGPRTVQQGQLFH